MADEENEFEELISREYGEDKDTPRVETLTPDMILKRLVWDIAPCSKAAEVSAKIGLHPASADIEEEEHAESHRRAWRVGAIIPFISSFSLQAAEVVRGAMMVGNDVVGPIEDDDLMPAEMLAPLLYQVALAIVAELNDIGVIELPVVPGALGYYAGE